jgi:hypothetical protein
VTSERQTFSEARGKKIDPFQSSRHDLSMKVNRQTNLVVSNSRWLAYTAAGAATAFGAAAEADIHYSGIINEPVVNTEKTFPLSNGAVLWFEHFGTGFSRYAWALFELQSAAVSNGWRSAVVFSYPKNLAPNRLVSNGHFRDGSGILAYAPWSTGFEFNERGFAILGFKFNTGGGTQYGWARLRMSGSTPPKNAFIVVDYAWADVGNRIKTLQTHYPSQEQGAVSPSASLGLLALGKAGLELWRDQRFSSVTGE